MKLGRGRILRMTTVFVQHQSTFGVLQLQEVGTNLIHEWKKYNQSHSTEIVITVMYFTEDKLVFNKTFIVITFPYFKTRQG